MMIKLNAEKHASDDIEKIKAESGRRHDYLAMALDFSK